MAKCVGCSGVVVNALALDLKMGCLRPGPCLRVVSLDKKLYSTLSLSTQGYN